MQQTAQRLYGNTDLITIHTGLLETSSNTYDWVVWNKPKNCKFAYMVCVGGGGGGGGGRAVDGTNLAYGGNGGTSAGISKLLISTMFLPDVLYLKAGHGGLGGIGGQGIQNGDSGSNGGESFICVAPFDPPSSANTVLRAKGGVGGPGGTSAAAGTTVANTPITAQECHLSNFGINQFLGGGNATAGGINAGATGPTTTNPPNVISGGAGGGGVGATIAGTGGAVFLGTNSIFAPDNGTSLVASTQGVENASNGLNYGLNLNAYTTDVITSRFPLITTGGTGGTGNAGGANGTRGACGGFGSGGGGGGGVNGSAIAGNGGNGGPGLVMIVCIT